jgi:hypothetical protein
MSTLEGEEKESGSLLKEIMSENFTNLRKTWLSISIPNITKSDGCKKSTPRCIVMKLPKIKGSKIMWPILYTRITIRL